MSSSDMPTEKKGGDPFHLQSQSNISLAAEISALQHELRRVRDGLERAGGSSHELERFERQLSKNISLCEEELAEM